VNPAPAAASKLDFEGGSDNVTTLRVALCAVLSLCTAHAALAADGPMGLLRKSQERMNDLLRHGYPEGSPDGKRVRAEIRDMVNAFLDYRELSKRSLGAHWDARTRREQDEFVAVLRDLIERNYVTQLRSNLDYDVRYQKEDVSGEQATVTTMLRVAKNNRTAETQIVYKMRRVEGVWLVFDIITDDVSLIQNYRTQFNRIITRESYPALLKKMRRKLGES
jgi:phospholipid transport system substrate-binding protein